MGVIIRGQRPADQFAQISNAALGDERLSYRARGILAFLLSRPIGWTASAESLSNAAPEGRDAVRTALRELTEHGYLVHRRRQDERGRWVTDVEVVDTPVGEVPLTPPTTGFQPSVDQPSVDQGVKTKKENKKKNPPTPRERERPAEGEGVPSMWRRLFTSWPEQRRGGWVSAQQQYRALVEAGWTEEQIHAAAAAYLADVRTKGTETRYVKMLGNFLREPDALMTWLPEDDESLRERIVAQTTAEYIEKGWTQDPETGAWSMPTGGGF